MIPAALLCVMAAGCVDQQPTSPKPPPRLARAADMPFNQFFTAWSRSYSEGPIRTQMFALDPRQDRQYAEWWPDDRTLAFARAYPGRHYIVGDEPDQYCMAPAEYAGIYHEFVTKMQANDPQAKFSPAGFAEPNWKCCPEGDMECRVRMHSISYAEQFYNAYASNYGAPPRVDEWRFHDFGISIPAGDVSGWWARVDQLATWSVSHGANMVLGGFAFHAWRDPLPVHLEHLKQAMGRLIRDTRITGVVYWSYEPWIHSPRPLVDDNGVMTPEGQTYANPLTDIPTALDLVAADGQAELRWTNTTSAWSTEVEFWVQGAGSDAFAHRETIRIGEAGAARTPSAGYQNGETVKARVRYYNQFGYAEWSPFSNAVLLKSPAPPAPPQPTKSSRKGPQFCVLLNSC